MRKIGRRSSIILDRKAVEEEKGIERIRNIEIADSIFVISTILIDFPKEDV